MLCKDRENVFSTTCHRMKWKSGRNPLTASQLLDETTFTLTGFRILSNLFRSGKAEIDHGTIGCYLKLPVSETYIDVYNTA